MLETFKVFIDYLWLFLSRENSEQEIWTDIRVLEYVISRLECIEMPEYKDGDADLLWYDSYGDTFDYLFRVSYMILHDSPTIVGKLNLDEELARIIQMEEKEALKYIPKMPQWDSEITEEEEKTVIKKVVRAFMEATACMEEMNRKS